MRSFYIYHHSHTLMGYAYQFYTGRYQGLCLRILLLEINSLVVNFRQHFLSCGKSKTDAYVFVKYLNVGTILYFRVFHLLRMTYQVVLDDSLPKFIPLSFTVFSFVNLIILYSTINSDFIKHGDFDHDLQALTCGSFKENKEIK